MSHYTKERNIITFHIDGKKGVYTLDLSTAVLVGLSGKPLKTTPNERLLNNIVREHTITHDNRTINTNLDRVLLSMLTNHNTASYQHYIQALQGAERLDAIRFYNYLSCDNYAYINANFNYITKYRATLENDSDFNFINFKDWVNLEKEKKELGSLAELITPEIYKAVKHYLPNPTVEEWGVMIYYLIRGKYWEYDNDCYKLTDYIRYCRIMHKKPEKQNNFMREYVETKKTYELNKKQYDETRLKLNYEERKEAFTFTLGKYSVVCPTCAKDIVDEGRNMHHCVGGYVDRVVNGDTYIVFIRETEHPDKCYLTCQVYTDGVIGQYYLAYDRLISKQEDIDFRNAFQQHLLAHWN